MHKISEGPIQIESDNVPVVSAIKNELDFLPHFLKHYRTMGVKQFLFIDNDSSDGSTDYLLAQDDCHVFFTDSSFRNANYGMDWINELISTYCRGRWTIFADCDELLVFNNFENVKIDAFCSAAATSGFNTFASAMIDMYPEGDFRNIRLNKEDNIFEIMPLFDANYIFRRWPTRFWDFKTDGLHLQVIGGPRIRLISNLKKEASHGAYYYTLCNQIDRFIDKMPAWSIKYLARFWPAEIPAMQKFPLNFIGDDFRYTNNHSCSNSRLSTEFIVLMHFKICEDLQKKMDREDLMLSHYRRGLSYQQLRIGISKLRNFSLVDECSTRFRSSHDLLKIGLVGDSLSRLWNSSEVMYIETKKSAL